jgi:hypothetical protein
LEQVDHPHIALAALNAADVRPVKASKVCEFFLRETCFQAELTDAFTEALKVGIHEGGESGCDDDESTDYE